VNSRTVIAAREATIPVMLVDIVAVFIIVLKLTASLFYLIFRHPDFDCRHYDLIWLHCPSGFTTPSLLRLPKLWTLTWELNTLTCKTNGKEHQHGNQGP